MPRRDVVLTGLIAFGAGVAVGVNWKKLGKEAAPLLEKLGLKMSDLADLLATVTDDKATAPAKPKSTRSRSKKSKATSKASSPAMAHRNGNGNHVGSAAKRKTSRPKFAALVPAAA
jgi:antitoxin component of RelBE/YafQ-DinJ toxin-antitoxin module